MPYTDNDFINLEYDGNFNNMPHIEISDTDKLQIDYAYINSSYNGTVKLEEVPGSATFTDGVTLSWQELKLQSNATKYGYNINGANWSTLESVFINCRKLSNIILHKTVTSIGASAFNECSNLVSVDTSYCTISKIGNRAFYNCKKLVFNIPNNVKSIGVDAFYQCISLVNINIPNGLTVIDAGAFQLCNKLSTVTFPYTLKSIGTGAFFKSGIEYIEIPMNITSLSNNAFAYCDKLVEVTIDATRFNIPAQCFQNCTSLTTVSIGANLSRMLNQLSNSCFESCTSLKNINYNQTTSKWNTISKMSRWNANTGNYTIHCTNGDLPKT